MDESVKLNIVREVFFELSRENKKITLTQVKETSKIENPEPEIEILKKRGIIIQLNTQEYMWV